MAGPCGLADAICCCTVEIDRRRAALSRSTSRSRPLHGELSCLQGQADRVGDKEVEEGREGEGGGLNFEILLPKGGENVRENKINSISGRTQCIGAKQEKLRALRRFIPDF